MSEAETKPGDPGIQRATLTVQIVDQLKKRILDGVLVSGDRIWAAQLAEEFGTSIIPVKEALLILQAENFITNVPRRGSIIRRFTRLEMEELYDLREMIEIEALRRAKAAGTLDDSLIQSLTECNEQIGALRRNGGFSDQAAAFRAGPTIPRHPRRRVGPPRTCQLVHPTQPARSDHSLRELEHRAARRQDLQRTRPNCRSRCKRRHRPVQVGRLGSPDLDPPRFPQDTRIRLLGQWRIRWRAAEAMK